MLNQIRSVRGEMIVQAMSPERRQLCDLIQHWNENRLDLFALSQPDEVLEFHGVMRFYFQEPGEKITTKCIRISSSANTRSVLAALIEKFHPDMKMLGMGNSAGYSIWEAHESGRERELGDEEHPLVVQLGWHNDDIEGRFLLRRRSDAMSKPSNLQSTMNASSNDAVRIGRSQQKRFSKREQKKRRERNQLYQEEDTKSVYAELPDTQFTRTISNPELVMKKRRERKLESRIREIGHGGSLKIYGVELFPDRPYVTLLVRESDTAFDIVGQALEKYNVEGGNSADFVLVELTLAVAESNLSQSFSDLRPAAVQRNGRHERYLSDDELPLLKMSHCPSNNVVYLLRKRPVDFPPQRTTGARQQDRQTDCSYDDGAAYQHLPAQTTASSVSQHSYQHLPPYQSTASLPANVTASGGGGNFHSSVSYPMGFKHSFQNQPTYIGAPMGTMEENSSPAMPYSNVVNVERSCIPCLVELYPAIEKFGFRLTPAFTLYAICRHRLTMPASFHHHYLAEFLQKFTQTCYDYIHVNASSDGNLAFWLGNASEFLQMLKRDRQLQPLTSAVQEELAKIVEQTFEFFVESRRLALHSTLPSLFLTHQQSSDLAPEALVAELDATVLLIRRCALLNPAFTIQIFAHLFHFINMYLFNWLVTTQDGKAHLNHTYAQLLRARLQLIHSWAERQGLEQAFECHMDRLVQAVNLLATPKTIDQIASLGATCYKLNSLQVRYLLENCQPPANGREELTDHVCYLAQQQADLMAEQDGQSVQLEEHQALQLPFLFAEDGYAAETLHGIPANMMNYLTSLQSRGLISIMLQSNCSGYWTGHMATGQSAGSTMPLMPSSIRLPPQAPDHASTNYAPVQKRDERMLTGRPVTLQLRRVSLRRNSGEGIGLSIVAAQGVGDKTVGIYVKKVVAGSPAHRDGRLESGDKLMSVNGRSLLGISQEEAAQRMISAGQEVHFEVAKGAAIFNGLDAWLKAETPALDHQKGATLSVGVNGGTQPPQQLLRHNRSISASELYSQADTMSLASLNSQQLPSYGHSRYGHGARLPPHYKMGSRQPAFVIQPSRPSPSPVNVHSTHSYGMRMIPDGNDHLRHPAGVFSRPQYRSASTVPADHYSNLPLISRGSLNSGGQQHAPMMPVNAGSGVHRSRLAPYRDGEENASLNSSTNSSGGNEVGAATGAAGTHMPSSNKPKLAYNGKHQHAPLSADSSGVRVRQLQVSSALPPSSSSSSSSSNQPQQSRRTHQRVPAFVRMDEGPKGSAWSSAQPTQHLSGRSSAPLFSHFGADNRSQQAEIKLSEMSAQQLNEELDRLDAKDSMTAADKSRYRQILELMERVQRGTAALATSRSATDFPHRRGHSEDRYGAPLEEMGPTRPMMLTKAKGPNFVLPYMSEMESKLLETKRKRAAEGFDGVDLCTAPNHQPKCHIESAIDDVSSVASRLHNAVSLVASPNKQADSDDALSPAKQRETPSVGEARGSRRRVQFREYSDQLVRAEEYAHTGYDSPSSINGGSVDHCSSTAQAVSSGPSEVYNDPRQRRLLEKEERASKQLRSSVDGACLGFRDKMKLFAAKLGDQPNNPPPVANPQEYCGRAKTSV